MSDENQKAMERKYTIIENPSEDLIDRDMAKIEEICMIHCPNKETRYEILYEWINNYLKCGYEIVYIHYYTGDITYSFGLRKLRD